MRVPKEPAGRDALTQSAVQRRADSVLQQQIDGSPRQQAQRSRIAQLRGEPQIDAPADNRTGMPDQLKQGIESLSGMDMSDVQVHRNSDKPAQLNALAYAQGNDIHLGPGQEQHLPHEAWHVVQQRQGRVQPTMQMKEGVPVNDDEGLEREADVMGEKALQLTTFQLKANLTTPGTQTHKSVRQLKKTAIVLEGEDVIDTDTKLKSLNHDRAGVHDWAKQRAYALGPFLDKPKGAVCNHHWSYADILSEFLDKNVIGHSVSDAAHNTMVSFNKLNSLGAAHGTHQTSLQYAIDYQTIARDRFTDAMNYYIYKICDFPGNLFYWPDHDDVPLDYPGTQYRTNQLPPGWSYVNAVNSNAKAKTEFDAEIDRLNDGEDAIKAAIA